MNQSHKKNVLLPSAKVWYLKANPLLLVKGEVIRAYLGRQEDDSHFVDMFLAPEGNKPPSTLSVFYRNFSNLFLTEREALEELVRRQKESLLTHENELNTLRQRLQAASEANSELRETIEHNQQRLDQLLTEGK